MEAARAHFLPDVQSPDNDGEGSRSDDDAQSDPWNIFAWVEVELVRPRADRLRPVWLRPWRRDNDLRVGDHALERGEVRGGVDGGSDEKILVESEEE